MSHTDYISKVPEGFRVIAQTEGCPVAAMEKSRKEAVCVSISSGGRTLERRKFLFKKIFSTVFAAVKGDWVMSSFVKDTIQSLKEKIGDKKGALCFIWRSRFLCGGFAGS